MGSPNLTPSPPTLPRAFYVASTLAGVCLTNLGVALPLLVLARGGSPAAAGDVLAATMVAVALGALASGPLVRALGARNVLAGGLAVMACGQVTVVLFGATLAGIVAGAVLVGAGLGCFWVGSQTTLGDAAGSAGAERGFVVHYTLYIAGSAAGAPATGAVADALRHAGVAHATSLRFAFGVGLAAALGALVAWPPSRRPAARPRREPGARGGVAVRGLALQVPDLLLVAAVALLTQLAPVILARDFHLSSATIGAVVGTLAGAKITGSLTAAAGGRRLGRPRTVGLMLLGAAAASLLLAPTRVASLFVVLLFVAVFGTTGAWPVVVEAAFARIAPRRRAGLAVAWNAREYAVVGCATATGGWVLTRVVDPAAVFLVAGGLLASSAALSRSMLRRPVQAPGSAAATAGETG